MYATLRLITSEIPPQMSWPILFLSHLPCGRVDTNLPCATLPKDCTISWHSRTFTRTGGFLNISLRDSTFSVWLKVCWCRLSQKFPKEIPVPETNPAPWKRVIPCWYCNLSSCFLPGGSKFGLRECSWSLRYHWIFGRDCKVGLPPEITRFFHRGKRIQEIWLGMSFSPRKCWLWISDLSSVWFGNAFWSVFLLRMAVQSEDHAWEECWWDMVITIQDFILGEGAGCYHQKGSKVCVFGDYEFYRCGVPIPKYETRPLPLREWSDWWGGVRLDPQWGLW